MNTNFNEAINNVLQEKNMATNDLFINNIIPKNTFYKYKKRNPNLQTLIKIANFLEISLDYIFELDTENKFFKYSLNQSKFYEKLCLLIKKANLSNRQFCKNLNYSKDALIRYKNGVEPSLRTLFEIVNYFNCSFDDILVTERQ